MMAASCSASAPGACVYLDDLGINCKPAAQLGMKAIKVVTEAQALDDLAGRHRPDVPRRGGAA